MSTNPNTLTPAAQGRTDTECITEIRGALEGRSLENLLEMQAAGEKDAATNGPSKDRDLVRAAIDAEIEELIYEEQQEDHSFDESTADDIRHGCYDDE